MGPLKVKLAVTIAMAMVALAVLASPAPPVQRTGSARARMTAEIDTEIKAANKPYPVLDAPLVITMKPLLLDMSDTSVEIEWMTDKPSDARVRYGEGKLDQVAIPQTDGLIPVATVHRVVLHDLKPGHTYHYQVVSRRVVKLRPYWPEMGDTAKSRVRTFITFDKADRTASFAFFTDTHEHLGRIAVMTHAIRQHPVDFVVDGGDVVNYAVSEKQLREKFLGPVSEALQGHAPLLYVRGNHENRGPYARSLDEYLHSQNDCYYYTRDDGPLHMLVVDTGEDKPDSTGVYAGLNDFRDYRRSERSWFSRALQAPRVRTAPFTVVLAHQPSFGWAWSSSHMAAWMELANKAHVDLMVAGHVHHFEFIKPGEEGNDFPILVVGINQVARVVATDTTLQVTVTNRAGKLVDAFTLNRKTR